MKWTSSMRSCGRRREEVVHSGEERGELLMFIFVVIWIIVRKVQEKWSTRSCGIRSMERKYRILRPALTVTQNKVQSWPPSFVLWKISSERPYREIETKAHFPGLLVFWLHLSRDLVNLPPIWPFYDGGQCNAKNTGKRMVTTTTATTENGLKSDKQQ